jgi:GntR family transcriptional repressor for pyruvate dehydrogenase complex
LEPGIAALAAQRITDEQIEGLEECLQDGEDCLDDHDSFVQCDIELHTGVTEAASNPLLTRFMVSLGELTQASRGRTVEIPGVAEDTMKDHRRIVAALKTRDADAAHQAMLLHLDHVEVRLQQVVASERGTTIE